jgi:hypothetical protein
MFQDSYKFTYHNCRPEVQKGGNFLVYTLSFRGQADSNNRKGLRYIVRVEEYAHHFLAIKLYPKNLSLSQKKYQLLTGQNNMPRILATCLQIMKYFYQKNPYVSFGFIGSNSEDEEVSNTKRYRIYRYAMEAFFSPTTFQHFVYEKQSAYILLNRQNAEKDLLEKITIVLESIHGLGLRAAN